MSTEHDHVRSEITPAVIGLIDDIVGGIDLLGIEVTAATRFHEDLQLESIDLVTLAGMLTDLYGPQVNLAAHLAEMDLDDVIDMTIGDIVDYVVSCFADAPVAIAAGDPS